MILCDDVLYGLTQQGGRDGQGTLFSYALGDNSYSKLFDFNYQIGNYPNGTLVELGSKLYGVASSGGMANRGVFFEINKDGTGFKPVIDFAETDAVRPVGSLIEINSVFYGLASSYATDYLVLYSSNADGSDFKIIYESDGVDAGRYGAALATDSTYIYAVSHQGGLGDFGVLFRFKIDGTEFSKLHDFNLSLGAFPVAPLVLDNGTLFISTSTGGVSGLGSVIGISTDGTDIFEIVDYGKLELLDGLKKAKISQTERLKSSSNESTIGAISVRNKNIYVVAEQTKGVSSQGGFFKFNLSSFTDSKSLERSMFKIHPIPAFNYLIIEHDKPQVTIQVYNAFGMAVINQTLLGNVLDVSMLPAGVYILKMGNQTAKFIKQ